MYLVSACLAGVDCRYDGGNCRKRKVVDLVRRGMALPVCPEVLGGLAIPRASCEIVRTGPGFRVINKAGVDVTVNFIEGAKRVLEMAKTAQVKGAIFKSKSPSCGCGKVYDGTFTGRLIDGNGVTADLLIRNGIMVMSEDDLTS